jgi:16S rRNA (uracil1498-N3)-methyltransferase
MVTMEWGEFVYAPPSAKQEDIVIPPADERHHLFRVRRMEAGSRVFVTDGEGMVYGCIAQSDHTLKVVETHPNFGEPARPIILYAAILKGDSNRETVDIATQLGASQIVLFRAQRSEGRLREDKLEKLRRIAITAIKQCGRACLPMIVLESSLESALDALPPQCTRFIAHPFEDVREPNDAVQAGLDNSSAVLIGPEGGFTEAEVDAALHRGCRPLILARRRLRAETAVAVGLSFLLTRRGEVQTPG